MILDVIVRHKKAEVRAREKKKPLSVLKRQVRALARRKPYGFAAALRKVSPVAVIAEIKKKSPSKGVLRKGFDPARIALQYEKAGAAALSVLTDEKFFGGSLEILKRVRRATGLPLLRKDFILSEYQVWETRLLGADALLLIAGILTRTELRRFSRLAHALGLDCLFEVHTESDLRKVLPLKPRLLGINNRDLRTFKVDLRTTEGLIKRLSLQKTFVVSESGIKTHGDLAWLGKLGVGAVLVGERLMTKPDPGEALREIMME
ncbi:MAG: indole-3-glycerol phosphate synthase TrpC [Candidatus Omnitrophica bacterium]|nr:indole-3-glycerol phosphate synthase TrpC [Candidatus Omnitrophota bacterium]